MPLKSKRYGLPLLLCSLTLSGCATTKLTETSQTTAQTDITTTTIAKEPLDGQTLFQLFLAEIATNRREYGAAASLYSDLGNNHNDVEAIRRAVALNHSIGNHEDSLALSLKWQRLRPQDSDATAAVVIAQLATGALTDAAQSLDLWLQQDNNADVSLILPVLSDLSRDQQNKLIGILGATAAKHPKSPSLKYTEARLQNAHGHADKALELLQQSLKLEDNQQVELFKFQILLQQQRLEEAERLIERLHKESPGSQQIAVQYSRLLIRQDPIALDKLQTLHTQFAADPTIARTYARAAFDSEAYDAAEAVFSHLLDYGHTDEAHYFLGRIDLINELPDSAIEHFDAIEGAPYLNSALAEWVSLSRIQDEQRILAKFKHGRDSDPENAVVLWRLQANYYEFLKQSDAAWNTLDSALLEFPESIELLYDQAMLGASLRRFDALESNLITILQLDPGHINAMNALGYTWADLNKNLSQAEAYIEAALAEEPDSAAFQDSKGWLLYRQGELAQALEWLQKAYINMKNDEVAAHIAEVLWHLDRPEDARFYRDEVIRLNPESPFIEKLNDLIQP